MKLSRRGFINVDGYLRPMPYGFSAMSPPYVRGLLERFEADRPTIYKGTSVGATTGILENAIGFCLAEFSAPPADAAAFAGLNYEGEPQWSTKESNPIDDIRATFALVSSPEYQAAQRVAYERELSELAALLRKPGPRPDLIVIDGVGYGKDDPLPPPFGSEA